MNGEYKMSKKDMARMKQLIEEKKQQRQSAYFKGDNKIGVGKVEKGNRTLGIDSERTKKISQ